MAHQTVNPNIFIQKHQESIDRTASTGLKSWRPKAAPAGSKALRNTIRIMPPHESMHGDPVVYFMTHFSLGPQQDTAAPCLEFFNKPCPACQMANDYFQKSREADNPAHAKGWKDAAFSIRAKHRYAINMVDLAAPEAGVQPWMFGVEVNEFIRQCFYDDNGEFRDVSHPETGRDILIDVVKRGESDFVDYPVFKPKETPSPLYDMALLDGIIDLASELIYEPTEEEVRAACGGTRIQRKNAHGQIVAGRPGYLSGTSDRQVRALPPAAARPVGSGSTQPAALPPSAPAAQSPPRRGRPPKAAVPPMTTAVPPIRPGPAGIVQPGPTGTPPRVPRTPVTDEAPGGSNGASGDFWAQSIALLQAQGVDPNANPQWARDLETLATVRRPPCYKREFEVTDTGCQGCRVVLPCAAVVNGWVDPALV